MRDQEQDTDKLENIHIWWAETQMLQLRDFLFVWVRLETQNFQEESFWAGQEGQWPRKLPADVLYISVIITVVGIIKQSFKLHRIS